MPAVEIVILVGLVVFVTHTLEAVTGFGCTVLAFPFVIFLMKDLEWAKIILSILAWVLAAYFVIAKFKYIHWKQFRIIFLFAGLGMPLGMLIFKSMDAAILKKALGIFIILSAAVQLYKCFAPVKPVNPCYRPHPFLNTSIVGYIFLFTGGIVHGAFAAGGPLVVLYSAGKIPDKGQFRATMCLLWTTLNTVLILQYFLERKLSLEVGYDVLFLLPFLIVGIFSGEIIHNRINEMLFKKIVFASLLLVGVTMVI